MTPTIGRQELAPDTGVDPTPVLHFPAGIAGFPGSRDFLLGRLPERHGVEPQGIFTLASLEDPSLRFVVADPGLFFPAYAPVVDAETVELVELAGAEDALLLVVLTLGATAADATANLRAPLVIHRRTGRSAQAVLAGDDWQLREPLAGDAA